MMLLLKWKIQDTPWFSPRPTEQVGPPLLSQSEQDDDDKCDEIGSYPKLAENTSL